MHRNGIGQNKNKTRPIRCPSGDGTWCTVADREEIHQLLLACNQAHFRQANPTPFGQNGNLSNAINPDDPDNSIVNLLIGDGFPWEDLKLANHQWIAELQQRATTKIDLTIAPTNFCQKFQHMKENKALSPS